MRPRLSSDRLYAYVLRFTQRASAAGGHYLYPTFRQVAKRFNVTLDDVEQACYDWQGQGYMQPAVGFRTGGGGVGEYKNKGDWFVEAHE